VQEIAEWLDKLGMCEYAQRFAENGISVAALRHLTDQDLKDIGVLLGHRRVMLAAISKLAGAAPATPEPTVSAEPKPQDTAERRQVTVMFSDLEGKGFSPAHRLHPGAAPKRAQFRKVINVALAAASRISRRERSLLSAFQMAKTGLTKPHVTRPLLTRSPLRRFYNAYAEPALAALQVMSLRFQNAVQEVLVVQAVAHLGRRQNRVWWRSPSAIWSFLWPPVTVQKSISSDKCRSFHARASCPRARA
jgi:SAM domain (Sterile alpha motif)